MVELADMAKKFDLDFPQCFWGKTILSFHRYVFLYETETKHDSKIAFFIKTKQHIYVAGGMACEQCEYRDSRSLEGKTISQIVFCSYNLQMSPKCFTCRLWIDTSWAQRSLLVPTKLLQCTQLRQMCGKKIKCGIILSCSEAVAAITQVCVDQQSSDVQASPRKWRQPTLLL